MNSEEEFIMQRFADFLDFFQIQPLYLQIIIIAFLTACTVGMVTFAYYCIKAVVTFFIKLIKGTFKIGEAAIKYKKPLNHKIGDHNAVTSPNQKGKNGTDVNEKAMKPNGTLDEKVKSVDYHCTNCGNKFSDKMMRTIINNEKVFCEYCGQGFVVEK